MSLVLVAAVSLIACKKKETALLTTKDGLIGSWKLKQQGSDINKNNKFDTEEKNFVRDTAQFSFQLFKEGTGFRVGANSSFVDTMQWDLFNYESTLRFKIYNQGFINNQFFKFQVGAKTLLLIDTTVSPSYFRSFEKEN